MEGVQRGRLILGGYAFDVEDCGNTGFYVFESDEAEGTVTVSLEVRFRPGRFGGDTAAPSINISEHETGRKSLSEAIGSGYSVKEVIEADRREDTLYVYEHEPFVRYTLQLLDKKDGVVHVALSGTAVVDGYSIPCETAALEGEFWLRVNEK